MNIFEIIITLAISLGAVVWGVNIYHQKGTWFLAGWNTMSKEEKATYNEEAICLIRTMCSFLRIGAFYYCMAVLIKMSLYYAADLESLQ